MCHKRGITRGTTKGGDGIRRHLKGLGHSFKAGKQVSEDEMKEIVLDFEERFEGSGLIFLDHCTYYCKIHCM